MLTETEANELLDNVLLDAYLYYWLDYSRNSDYVYDFQTKMLYDAREKVTSPYRKLIDWNSLSNCSSLHYIHRSLYPERIKQKALSFING